MSRVFLSGLGYQWLVRLLFFLFKQKTAYEMRISDWSSDVCSSDLTTDGGESWRSAGDGLVATYMPPEQQRNPVTQDPHRLVRCRAAPDTMWIQHHNGIFHSETGVDGWSQIETVDPSFGFAVAVHPERPGPAWFVPAIKDAYRYPKDGRLRSEEHTSE